MRCNSRAHACRDKAIDRQIVDGYTRIPKGGEDHVDEWGSVGTLMTALMADQLRQLNSDEREAGFGPW